MTPDVPRWVRDAVFYQIFPDRFAASARVHKPGPLEPWDAPPTRHGFKGGDLLGIAEHLDHLEALGVTAISLNPVFTSASNHRYHTYDYMAIDPLLGGDAALRELLDAVHARGMRLILDGVFNHASRGFWPFHHVLESGANSPYRGWFHFNDEMLAAGRVPRAYPELLDDPVPADWSLDHGSGMASLASVGYRGWWDLPALPKFNTDNPEVRAYLLGVAEHWTRFGADGWRLDVAGEIDDPTFWRAFRERVRSINPEAYIVAEMWSPSPHVLGGDQFDAVMNYPLAAAIIGFVAAEEIDVRVLHQNIFLASLIQPLDARGMATALERELAHYQLATTAAMFNLLDGHDTPRLISMCGGDEASFRLATLLQLTLPGAPCLYYGDEVGLPGEADPDCRRAMPWDETRWDADRLAFVKAAIALRHASPDLRSDGVTVIAAEGRALAFRRGAMVVAVNAGTVPALLALPAGEALPLPGWEAPRRDGSNAVLAPRSAAVIAG
ncbi:MAG: glycoside hydrolase family 13 protein [Chloroflexota bacterium]